MNTERPRHLALLRIELPLPGLVSILHRISGLLLFLSLPVLLLMLQYSLRSIETYTQLLAVLVHPLSRVALFALLWAFLFHFCAGLRFLAADLHYLGNPERARASSVLVMAVSLALTVLLGAKLW